MNQIIVFLQSEKLIGTNIFEMLKESTDVIQKASCFYILPFRKLSFLFYENELFKI